MIIKKYYILCTPYVLVLLLVLLRPKFRALALVGFNLGILAVSV